MHTASSISPASHQSETLFPVERHSPSTQLTEYMGAFGEMSHSQSRQSSTGSSGQRLRVDMSSSNSSHHKAETPILPNTHNLSSEPHKFNRSSYLPSDHSSPVRDNSYSTRSSANSQKRLLPPNSNGHFNRSPVRFERTYGDNLDTVYMPTTIAGSQAGSSDSKRRHDKLSDVYSQSGDTVEFAKNLSDYINDRIPYQVSITLLAMLGLLAFLLIIFGILNLPFCTLEPMIPIWLIVEGCLFIISATFRIYFLIPIPKRSQNRRRQRKLGASLLCKGLEILFFLANIVWLILGCVWTFGSRSYVHFNEGMFEQHYCDPLVYWSAFIACTVFLIFHCSLIIFLICVLVIGSFKEVSNEDQELD